MDLSDDDFQPLSSVLRASQAKVGKRPVKRSRVDKGSNASREHLHPPQCPLIEVGFRAPGGSKLDNDSQLGDSFEGKEGAGLREISLENVENVAGSSCEIVSPRSPTPPLDGEQEMEQEGFGTQLHILLSLCKNATDDDATEDDDGITELMTQVDRTQSAVQGTATCKVAALQDITNTVWESVDSAEDARKRQGGDVRCPVCNVEIGVLSVKEREDHSNACLDGAGEKPKRQDAVEMAPVVEFLEKLNLSRYAPIFVKEEIDWDTLQWLTEEDLASLGIETFGPRKKIVSAVKELRNVAATSHSCNEPPKDNQPPQSSSKKYITDFFGLPGTTRTSKPATAVKPNDRPHKDTKQGRPRKEPKKVAELREWMKIPGTKFRVDAFKHLSTECSHWFLTHFHSDHYQGLTKSFRYGKIYCSMITARLVNLRIGIPWDRLHPLDFNTRTEIDGAWITLLDANHCPGAAMILFETTNGKAVLHTGDFRFCEEMTELIGRIKKIETLILDTTYCNPQYDFPKQESVIQFVIDAIQAESFNPKTLYLIGTYSLGKERLFLEVARVLRQKIYVGAVKRRMLACLELSKDDMDLITTNDWETNIHIVPLWSIASFKRMTSISRHYHGKFNTIVSFSPTGWSFVRGKKRSTGRRAQQGTVIRYEVPYSEHSSFTELKQFVKVVAPLQIIPSVNNTSKHAAESMVNSLL